MAYDSSRGVTVLFGGFAEDGNGGTNYYSDTWEWNGTAWTQSSVVGLLPALRHQHAMAFETAQGRTIVFGGNSLFTSYNGETWGLRSVCGAPSLISQPVTTTTCPSGTAAFSIMASGAGPFTYQWQLQTAPNTWTTLGNDPGPLPCGGSASAYAAPLNSPTVTIGIHPCPGSPTAPQHFQIRALVTNAGGCGSVTTNEATYTICPADFNCSGAISVQDIFDFLAAYFANQPAADVNANGSVSVQDIFDFLAAYFAGCAG
jgi:hypothetical protein